MPIENRTAKIYNIMAMKEQAKPSSDWLSKAKELKELAASKAPQSSGTYEKLPSLKLKLLNGSPEEPEILVVKALNSPHPSQTPEQTLVFEAEILYSESKQIPLGKYNIWYGYTVFNAEMDGYVKDYGQNGSIDGQTFVIASIGESTPKRKGARPAKLFRIFPPP